jgi:hypothetical protein
MGKVIDYKNKLKKWLPLKTFLQGKRRKYLNKLEQWKAQEDYYIALYQQAQANINQ